MFIDATPCIFRWLAFFVANQRFVQYARKLAPQYKAFHIRAMI